MYGRLFNTMLTTTCPSLMTSSPSRGLLSDCEIFAYLRITFVCSSSPSPDNCADTRPRRRLHHGAFDMVTLNRTRIGFQFRHSKWQPIVLTQVNKFSRSLNSSLRLRVLNIGHFKLTIRSPLLHCLIPIIDDRFIKFLSLYFSL